ncbi:hypothetical protein GOBAR_DD31005 [Gossypium barbadense]|nr:hypothetical protein GOBAR_DD31005 [Gossypium barbadense]
MVVDDESGRLWLQDDGNGKECCAMERNQRPPVDLNKWVGKQRYLESGFDMGKILFGGDSGKKWKYLRRSESHRWGLWAVMQGIGMVEAVSFGDMIVKKVLLHIIKIIFT